MLFLYSKRPTISLDFGFNFSSTSLY
uniref:Uncharacterized protein n=1 Tax=Rhizophora mucronata TaxID=61149 RepID=A0A2P2PD92_RHIMU